MAFLGIPDEALPVVVPIAVYWLAAGVYELTLNPKEKHRLFTKEEEDAKNLATPRQVVVGVLINQAAQILITTAMFMSSGGKSLLSGGGGGGGATSPLALRLLKAAGQLSVAMLVMDFCEYFWHRWTHESKFLYKYVHGMHHHLVVPYCYGSQYIHPADSIVGEGIGGLLATLASGMSPRTATVFFTLLTLKGLDDHCGMWFPGHPIHRWFANNSAFHALHHQHAGIKYNYSVHYLATWDFLLGTYLPFSVEQRRGGGYQISLAKDN